MLAHQWLQKPDAGLWRDALALRALAGGISAGVSCSATATAMTTAMGRIEASAQVEPLPPFLRKFCRLLCPMAHTGAPGATPPARPLAAPAGLVRNELVASDGPNLTRGAGTRTRNSVTPRRATHDAT